jgi:ferredoxin-NADP reductase
LLTPWTDTETVSPAWIVAGTVRVATVPPWVTDTVNAWPLPDGFVESATQLLLQSGFEPSRIRTERFGPSGQP